MIFEEFLFFAVCFVVLAVILLARLLAGPTIADRALAADCIEILSDMALILFALYSGRGIFLDIALITAIPPLESSGSSAEAICSAPYRSVPLRSACTSVTSGSVSCPGERSTAVSAPKAITPTM